MPHNFKKNQRAVGSADVIGMDFNPSLSAADFRRIDFNPSLNDADFGRMDFNPSLTMRMFFGMDSTSNHIDCASKQRIEIRCYHIVLRRNNGLKSVATTSVVPTQ